MSVPGETASFGFQDIPAADKAARVKGVFDSVAGKYDLMNDLMSAGVHRLWKDALVDWLDPAGGIKVVDVGGGTGDIALRIGRKLGAKGGNVTILDINHEMLKAGRTRADFSEVPATSVQWVCGDAETLPLPDRSVDAYTIAFCIRNVTHIARALSEARRVLKMGGRFLCLEFSRVDVPGLDALYDLWSFNVLPELGARVAGDRESYRYLVESIRRFPPQEKFAAMIEAAGFGQVKVRNLSGGIAAMHSGWVI
ncbi:MAG: class I SAM-dependent methyltransferase [Alphaproteobacteria bacterium]|nr:class I SAM-dependent methyltransferase [Alphaproteobacteria bacterium]